jgi:hypothetical protein
MINVKAKMNFFHDLVGNRSEGEVFQVGDNATYSALQKAGYVEKVSAEARETSSQNVTNVEAMNPFAKNNQSAEQVGQAQAEANKQAGTAAQAQHEQQLQAAEQQAQQAQQQAQNATSSAATEFLAQQEKIQQVEQKNAQSAQQSATNKTTK